MLSPRILRDAIAAFDRLAEEIDDINGWIPAALEPGSAARTMADKSRAELERALARKPLRKKAKSKAKRERTSEVYQAVARRAGGRCECGCGGYFYSGPLDHPVFDHFFGRAKADETPETCWLIRADCNREKTDNHPSASVWIRSFVAHCEKYGYRAEADRARARLEGMVALREAERGRP